MDAWRSSCPKHTVWENCVSAGYVQIVRSDSGRSDVTLTPKGEAALAQER
jgi:hypothetical protein